MLSLAQISAMSARLDGVHTLSAYVPLPPGSTGGVARTLLRQGVTKLRDGLTEASHLERSQFEACVDRLLARADAVAVPSAGATWFGVASADGSTYDEILPGVLPSTIAWDARMRVAPYIAAIDPRTITVALVDRQRATLARVHSGAMTTIETWTTEPMVSVGPHMNAPPRQGFNRGTGGLPGADAAARQIDAAAERHLTRVVDRVRSLVRSGEWAAVLGAAEFSARAAGALEAPLGGRVVHAGALPVTATPAELRASLAPVTAEIRALADARLVGDVLERAPGRQSAVGLLAVDSALTQSAAHEVVVSDRWLASDPDAAESLVRRAGAVGAGVVFVFGDASARLAQEAGGVAASLRFTPVAQAVAAES